MNTPLANYLRPTSFDFVVGQSHILGENKTLKRIVESGDIPNMIFYGPSGTGKTTVANIIAAKTNRTLKRLNATTASLSDIKDVIDQVDTLLAPNGILLYLDEIQYFNKKQQQSLLEFIESGKITLIASTTENPYFYVYNAILSRSTVFEFKPVEKNDIKIVVQRAFKTVESEKGVSLTVEDGVADWISTTCGGDVRKAINTVELLTTIPLSKKNHTVTLEETKEVAGRSNMRYDRDADMHYDILSAFQKSIRGSDENAALHYLARLVLAGDLISICRRLLVIACEDIGLAYPSAITAVKACVDSATQLGFPEARIPLAQAVILLACAPKSNSAINAIDAAIADVNTMGALDIPADIKDAHYSGAKKLERGIAYKYPHNYEHHYVKQQYLPNEIKNKKYYSYGDNKAEKAAEQYWQSIKKDDK